MKRYLLPACIAFALAAQEPPSIQKPRPRTARAAPKTSRTFFNGELLYWLPEMDGLKYVQERVYSSPEDERKGGGYYLSPKEIKGDWEPGFRATAGHIFDEKGWDASFSWTYFGNAPTASFNGKGCPAILPQPPPRKEDPNVIIIENKEKYKPLTNTASGKWRLIQNIADLEVGRRFPVGDLFLARTFFGLRDAVFHNKTLFRYSYDPKSTRIGRIPEIAAWSKYWGLGPRIGGSAFYEFAYGLGVYALGSGSLLMGNVNSTFNRRDIKSHPWVRIATTLQIQTGIQWKKAFANRARTSLLVAWEQNFYNGVNPSVALLDQVAQGAKMVPASQDAGDLLMKGWTGSLQFDY